MFLAFSRKLKPLLSGRMLPVASFIYRTYMKASCLAAAVRDVREIKKTGFKALPPASLRYKVHGSPDLKSFLAVGKECSDAIESALSRAGKPFGSLEKVLDFGCGSGRTLLWFQKYSDRVKLYGTDIDGDTVQWCKDNLTFGTFGVNDRFPPLIYPDNEFDLIYAISVLTHLDEPSQMRWLEELGRVTKKGGLLILSVHGVKSHEFLSEEHKKALLDKGFIYVKTDVTKGLFPSWYQSAYHTEDYVRREFSRYFKIREYISGGMGWYQDLILLEK